MNIILASKSPRRKELLAMSGYSFSILTAEIDEEKIQLKLSAENQSLPAAKRHKILVQKLAEAKGRAVAAKLPAQKPADKNKIKPNKESFQQKKDKENERILILAADTIVCLEDQILGKPADTKEAEKMLILLSGRTHLVHTGMAFLQLSANFEIASIESFVNSTEVEFLPLNAHLQARIRDYAAGGGPLDKAGAYGIQDEGAVFVAGIKGDYYNVMGLPLSQVVSRLDEIFSLN